MTAYGNSEHTSNKTSFAIEIKSVNNRYRDIFLRIPKSLQPIEDEIRGKIASKVRRGRLDVSVQMERAGIEDEYELELNLPLIKGLMSAFKQLHEDFGVDSKVKADDLCQMKDVLMFRPEAIDLDEIRSPLMKALDLALESHNRMRLQEGKAIENDFIKRLDLLTEHLKHIEERAPLVVKEYAKKLKEKVDRLCKDVETDQDRIAQEIAIFADKCDITEETVRFTSHLQQFRKYMSADEAVGRRLDFLLQEIHREANTMSAKATDTTITAIAVEIKGELEKLREQVQNVE